MRLGHPPDRPLGAQQVILPHHLVQALRPQPVGQGRRRLGRQAGGFKEVAHHAKVAEDEEMPMPLKISLISSATLAAWLLAGTVAAAAAPSATPIEVAVPFRPDAGDRRWQAETLLRTPLGPSWRLAEIDELEILRRRYGRPVERRQGRGAGSDAVSARRGKGRPGWAADGPGKPWPCSTWKPRLPPGVATPGSLVWRLRASLPGAPAANAQPPIEGRLPISRHAPLVIRLPLPAGDWVAANGPSNTSGHRRALQIVDGRARIAQRFAIDWVKLGPDGRVFHGDKALNPSWYDFGTPVLAVADAKVSASHDGIPENEPSDKRAVPITLETVGGNYLTLDLGGGRFAFYAHLQPGSQKVKVGDVVHRGQVLALLGNTGNSDAPHLHFHVSDANSPLGAEGLPYVFESFQELGKAPFDQIVGPAGWKASTPATIRRGEIPGEDAVVRIP